MYVKYIYDVLYQIISNFLYLFYKNYTFLILQLFLWLSIVFVISMQW